MDYVVAGGSLRTQSNGGNACAVGTQDTAVLSGIPAGSTISAAYLYWAGSGPTPDNVVTLNGSTVNASRTFTETYVGGGLNLPFFSGFADVTSLVSGNGSFTFGGLTVTNTNLGGGQSFCSVQAVLAGWGLVVIYENSAEPLRVINLFDGFQQFRGSQVNLAPNNFVIPNTGIDGKIGVLSWEGDVENSAPLGGVTENLVFNGQSVAPVALTDGFNPLNNQYNSTINGAGASNSWGVDFDTYDISPYLTAGDTTAATTYASGGDLVLLSLEIISVTNAPAADLALAKSHVGDFSISALNEFLLNVSNNGPSSAVGPITITDSLAAGLTYQGYTSSDGSWSCGAVGQDVTCTHPGPLAAGGSLAAVSLQVDADIALVPSVSNTAVVSSPTFDYATINDTATDTAVVAVPDLATSDKSVVDVNGGVPAAGDTLRYRIRLTETAGVDAGGVIVTDSLDAALTNLVVIDPGTGTNASTGTMLSVTDLTIPAGGFVDVVFEADIVGSATAGDVIPNTATVEHPADGTTLIVASPDIVVGSVGVPATGIKPLYFGDIAGSQNNPVLPMTLSRVPLGTLSSPTRVRVRRQDNDRVWALTPALQADLGIDAAPIPVYLQLRRNNSSSNRNVRVSLDYVGASTGFFGCVDVTLSSAGANGLSNTVTREFLFNVPRTDANCNVLPSAPLTLAAGTQLQVRVDNEPVVGPGGQAIFVYPYSDSAPAASRVEIPATTVINVDSVETHSVAYPGASLATDFVPNDTLFLRAVVSDPFGTFDIASVNYEIVDADGVTQASGTMSVVDDTGVAVVTAEATYPFGPNPAAGVWTVIITANEGTEGTVSHVVQTSFNIVVSSVLVEKFVSALSDPVSGASNAKSIPQAVHEYVIRVSNEGPTAVDADSIIIADTLPSPMRMYFGDPAGPVAFVDGGVASGLSFSYLGLGNAGDDIQFSNDSGASFTTPVVGPDGFDATVPPINFLQVTPSGTFNAPGGGADPSFELRFQMRLE